MSQSQLPQLRAVHYHRLTESLVLATRLLASGAIVGRAGPPSGTLVQAIQLVDLHPANGLFAHFARLSFSSANHLNPK